MHVRYLPSVAPVILLAACGWAQPPAAPAVPGSIEVDQYCRIVTVDTRNPAHPKQHLRSDGGICHIEGENDSVHWERLMVNGALKEVAVGVREREFILHDPYPQPVTFIVSQPIPRRYHVDSEPPPDEISNSTAIFRVDVQPARLSASTLASEIRLLTRTLTFDSADRWFGGS